MNLICLAEAQGAALRKAVEKGMSVGLLSKLDCGIKELLDQAYSILNSFNGKCEIISAKLEEFICFSRSLHELRSKRYLADSMKNGLKKGNVGLAIGVLRIALENIKGKTPKKESWQLVFKKEIKIVHEILRKLEQENGFVYHERVPIDVDQFPSPESRIIVKAAPYDPKSVHSGASITKDQRLKKKTKFGFSPSCGVVGKVVGKEYIW
ncbi:BRO1 domain-containing protein BROX-like, partial [Papaver somniferum]|uniref:BRO1 domain-containing protein BROX-like n=1 Tax=Papaver somniferum TaxID=3469 RepID=UPI000E6F4CFF